jgi:hypothetical protein
MARKGLATSRSVKLPDADDLKLINGIGPAVENRLNLVGIFRFAQLATLSPADIAASVSDLAGLSAERIAKQDWIGQARRLAASSKSTGTQRAEEIEPAPLVEPEPELPAVAVEELKPALPAAPEPEPITLTVTTPGTNEAEVTPPATSIKGGGGVVGILKMELVSVNGDVLQNFSRHNQPYTVRLTLELTGVELPIDTPFNYKAYFFCKNPESHSRKLAGETSGTFTFNDNITIDVKGIAFPGGAYLFLQALITLWPITETTITQTNLQAWSDPILTSFV